MPPTVRKTSIAVLDNEGDLNAGLPSVGEKVLSQTTSKFEAGFMAASVTPKEVVADREGQRTKDMSEDRYMGHLGERNQSNELRDFMQVMRKENAQ